MSNDRKSTLLERASLSDGGCVPDKVAKDRKRGLIQTKFTPVRVGDQFIHRDRLLRAALKASADVQVITIVGAAGSGKSILMGHLFAELHNEAATCWVSLDADDNNLNSFLAYFTAALAEIDPALGLRASGMINADLNYNVEAAFCSLREDISQFSKPMVIFLDDFQSIDLPEITKGMSRWIAALPPNVMIVLASRSEVKLELSKRRIDGSLKEFTQDDVNFSVGEASELLEKMYGVSLGEFDAERLTHSTEGWATGLSLAGLTLKRSGQNQSEVIDRFSGADSNLNAYLMETVFNSQSKDVQMFLLMTSPLGRMNAELCADVMGYQDTAAMLTYLQRENMFLIALDTEGVWFRYHHLFAEFLTRQLERNHKGELEQVSYAASQWFAKAGLNTEAIKYLFTAGRYKEAAEFIAIEGKKVAQCIGDHRTILDWMRLLPEEYHDLHPQILLNYAWAHAFTRSSKTAYEIAERVRYDLGSAKKSRWKLPEDQLEDARCLADAIQSVSLNADDDITAARSFSTSRIAAWPEALSIHKATFHNSRSLACLGALDFDEGLRAASIGRVESLKCDAPFLSLWSDWLSAVICIEQADLNEAEGFISRCQAEAQSLGSAQAYGDALIGVLNAELLYNRRELDKASKEISGSAWFSAIYGPLEPLFFSSRVQAQMQFAAGQTSDALRGLRKGQELGLVSNLPRLAVLLGAEEVKLLLRINEVEEAKRTAKRWELTGERVAPELLFDRSLVADLDREIHARLLMAKEDYGAALAILMGLAHNAKSKQHGRRLMQLQILKSIALWRLERKNAAMRELAVSTTLAAPHKFIAPFFEADPVLVDILTEMVLLRTVETASELGASINFERQTLASLTGNVAVLKKETDVSEELWAMESLTRREIEILNLVSEGLGNQELADSLLVTVPTIKWHLHNVFEKLDVRRRTAAVSKARQLKLID